MTAPRSDDYIRFLDATSTQPGQRHPALSLLQLQSGERCLDVGCGTGEDDRSISDEFGVEVVGIDQNPRMVDEARSRSAGRPRLSFHVAEAENLPLPDASFDAAWTKRTLIHVGDPIGAVSQMARVVKPGGRIVVVEPDLEGVLLDSEMVDVTRQVLALHAASYRNPRAGRRLRKLMTDAHLVSVRVAAEPLEIRHLAAMESALRLLAFAQAAVSEGVLDPDAAAHWEEDLRARDAAGVFACYALMFVAVGVVPDPPSA